MQIGIAGRPGAGKSALFDLLGAGNGVPESSGKGGLRIAHVRVPDPRVDDLASSYRPKKTTHARLVFQDLEQKSGPNYPALSPDRREMLARSDLVLLVIGLHHVPPDRWEAEAMQQWREVREESALTDLAVVETRLERLEKLLRIGQKPQFPGEPEVLARLRAHLEEGRQARDFAFTPDEERGLRGYSFLSARPLLPAFNIDEAHLAGAGPVIQTAVRRLGAEMGGEEPPWLFFSAEVERQIQNLPAEEQGPFLEAFGLEGPAVGQLIRAAYALAGLISFFTVGGDEVRAWTVRRGALAPAAAGVIHSDLEKGFVRAEVLAYDAWKAHGGENGARERGAWRLEGKEYRVQDGEIVHVRSGLAKGGRG